MAHIARTTTPNYPHHITQPEVCSINVFRNDDKRLVYLKFISDEAERFGVEILACYLMTNHIHLIAVPKIKMVLVMVTPSGVTTAGAPQGYHHGAFLVG